MRRNGVEESLSFQYEKKRKRLVNYLNTVLTSRDHNADFKCTAQNQVTKIPRVKKVRITVDCKLFAIIAIFCGSHQRVLLSCGTYLF